jgi:hypothetical protein
MAHVVLALRLSPRLRRLVNEAAGGSLGSAVTQVRLCQLRWHMLCWCCDCHRVCVVW